MQQSFDNCKSSQQQQHYKTKVEMSTAANQLNLFKTQDRLDKGDGYNSLTQMTFDYGYLPSGKASYLGGGLGSSGLGVNLSTENCNYDS